jgi:hypothetical protein
MTDEEVHVGIIDDPDTKPTDEALPKGSRVVMLRRRESVPIRWMPTFCNGLAANAAIKSGRLHRSGVYEAHADE